MVACGILASALFTGCGGGEQGSSGGGDAKPASGDEIVIGANFELTGNHAQYGANANNGLKLAIKEVNDAGGVNGKKIKIVEADAKSEAAESVNAATKLISDDKVIALIGPAVTANVIAESQVATDNKIPIIAPAATNPDVTVENGKVKPFVFRSCFIDPQQSEVMAQFAAKDLNAKTAVLYLDSSSDYSKSLGKIFKERFEADGGKVVMEEAFLAKDQDFKAALTKIQTANADVIFVPAYYEEVGKIIKQARELGITAAILGTDGWDDNKVVEIAGKDALNNTYFCTHYFDGDEEVQGFIKAYKGEYNNEPNVFAALGYDAGKMLINAIERGGDDSQKIRDNIETIKDLPVGTGKITMDAATHNPIKGIVVIETKDGVRELRAKIAPEG
ncbi:MAG: ABC transporter substrate-binding protein [Selenomonadaceae bacterium]|nr:ABC transporter substrate-binding protein [Selenomonadaceae bacterium]MBQ6759602.1 ABC transporter substrate-binding protein [Selenomonadaceae bacterium]